MLTVCAAVMSGDQGTILAVIFRWVKSYDMADGYSELLEWVKSKTGTYIQVTGWSSRCSCELWGLTVGQLQ